MNAASLRLAGIRRRMVEACRRSGRASDSVRLLAVSKTFDPAGIAEVAAEGQQAFAESYVQEALAKRAEVEQLAGRALDWHYIGPIQSNKTAAISANFAWVHGVDRLKIAERLSAQRPAALPPLEVCVQVNVSGEPSKSGCAAEAATGLCAAVAALPRLRLRGLMAIPAPIDDPEQSRPAFRALRALLESIRQSGAVDPAAFDSLSMGMSDDFEIAIEEGATMVRVGSAIFGDRRA